jgi:hypothetical protein
MSRNWMRLTHDAVMLGLEAQRVIGLRLIKLSGGGPAAQAEAFRMVSEKTAALAEAGLTLARGGSAGSVNTTLSNACQIEQAALIEVIRPKPTRPVFVIANPLASRCRT